MTKMYCDMCGAELNPLKALEVDSEWKTVGAPNGWIHVTGDLCATCDYTRHQLHAKLDSLLMNRCGDKAGTKHLVTSALNAVPVWKDDTGYDEVSDDE